jgi:hypothetical protein
MKNIVVAYHAFLFEPYYRVMMSEQFGKLKSSGLFDVCSKLHIGIVNQSADGVQWVEDYWKGSDKVEIVVYPDNMEETRTLKWISAYAMQNPDDYLCYFHTKSIWRYTPPTEAWRRYMEYFIIERWEECVKKLDYYYDCCGVMWNPDTPIGFHPHFSGNFWWTTTKYIRTLNNTFLDTPDRYDREFWIGSNPDVKAWEFHNSGINNKDSLVLKKGHYDVEYPQSNYATEKNMKLHIICTVFKKVTPMGRLIYDMILQSNPNWFMHVIHDGKAPQELIDLIDSFKEPRIDFRETPQINGFWGFPNRKLMVQEVQSEPQDFILCTNDDNQYLQVFVEYFLNACQPDVGFVYCDTIHNYMGYDILKTEVRSCHIDMGSFIVRSDVAKKVGFNHQHEQADGSYAEECAAECRARGLRIVYIPKCLFVHN